MTETDTMELALPFLYYPTNGGGRQSIGAGTFLLRRADPRDAPLAIVGVGEYSEKRRTYHLHGGELWSEATSAQRVYDPAGAIRNGTCPTTLLERLRAAAPRGLMDLCNLSAASIKLTTTAVGIDVAPCVDDPKFKAARAKVQDKLDRTALVVGDELRVLAPPPVIVAHNDGVYLHERRDSIRQNHTRVRAFALDEADLMQEMLGRPLRPPNASPRILIPEAVRYDSRGNMIEGLALEMLHSMSRIPMAKAGFDLIRAYAALRDAVMADGRYGVLPHGGDAKGHRYWQVRDVAHLLAPSLALAAALDRHEADRRTAAAGVAIGVRGMADLVARRTAANPSPAFPDLDSIDFGNPPPAF